jgi:hypothetical protein
MGACLLHKVFVNEAPIECTAASQCAQHLPIGGAWTGGSYYCQASYGTDTTYCYVRQASSLACVGSPAMQGQAIPAGTYYTDSQNATDYPYSSNATGARGYTFMAQACYQGCATTPSSNSIETTYVPALDRWFTKGF